MLHSISLTVVIPLYNKANTIYRAVNSVYKQLAPGDSLIIVDDGSTDGGVDKLSEFMLGSLQIIRQKNCGVSVARNVGFKAAKTEHVSFLDADDFWLPGALDEFRKLVTLFPDSIMYCLGHKRISPQHDFGGRLVSSVLTDSEVVTQSGTGFINSYAREQLINSSSVCVKKKELEAIGGFPVNVLSGEDIYVWLRLALRGSVTVQRAELVVVERARLLDQPVRDLIPYHFKWFLNKESVGSLSTSERRAVRNFFFFRGAKICFADLLVGYRKRALTRALFIGRCFKSFYLVAIILAAMPRCLIKLLLHGRA